MTPFNRGSNKRKMERFELKKEKLAMRRQWKLMQKAHEKTMGLISVLKRVTAQAGQTSQMTPEMQMEEMKNQIKSGSVIPMKMEDLK